MSNGDRFFVATLFFWALSILLVFDGHWLPATIAAVFATITKIKQIKYDKE